LWKTSLKRKREKVSGSFSPAVHLIVTDPPEVGFSGTRRLRAETRGAKKAAKRLSLLNILLNYSNFGGCV
jgi:hypothetical protein